MLNDYHSLAVIRLFTSLFMLLFMSKNKDLYLVPFGLKCIFSLVDMFKFWALTHSPLNFI